MAAATVYHEKKGLWHMVKKKERKKERKKEEKTRKRKRRKILSSQIGY